MRPLDYIQLVDKLTSNGQFPVGTFQLIDKTNQTLMVNLGWLSALIAIFIQQIGLEIQYYAISRNVT